MAKHSGMGAIPHAMGVTFRVWAPHAEKVYLTGTFNVWVTKDVGAGEAGFKAQWDFEFVHPVHRGNFFTR